MWTEGTAGWEIVDYGGHDWNPRDGVTLVPSGADAGRESAKAVIAWLRAGAPDENGVPRVEFADE